MKRKTKILVALAAGAAIGAVALFLASDKGKKAKEKFKETARKFAGEAEDLFSSARDQVRKPQCKACNKEAKHAEKTTEA